MRFAAKIALALILGASPAWATVADLNSTYSLQTFSETELTDLDVSDSVTTATANARLSIFNATFNNPNARTCQVTLTQHRDDSQVATKTFQAPAGNSTLQLAYENTGLSLGSHTWEGFVSASCLPMSFTTDTTMEVVGYTTVAGLGLLDGSGTADRLAKWDDTDSLTDSLLSDDGTTVSALSNRFNLGTGSDVIFQRYAADTLQLGLDASGTPNAVSIRGANSTSSGVGGLFQLGGGNGTGTNQAGGVFRLVGGAGTGNATGGSVAIFTPDAGASGTALQTTTAKWYFWSTGTIFPALDDSYDIGDASLRIDDLFMAGNLLIDHQQELRLGEPDGAGSEYVSFKAPATLAASTNYTLPSDDGDASQVLSTDGAGVLDWVADDDIPDSGDFTNLALSGDVSSSALVTTIGADKVLESHLKAVDAAVDEECLTYESTTGDFEWQTCGSAGGYATIDDEDTPLTQRTTLNFEGAGVTCADDTNQTTCTISGASGGKPWEKFTANQAFLPAASFATQDTRNTHPVLDFDAAADECAYFGGYLNSSYAAGGLNVILGWMATSATTGATGWLVSIEAHPDDALDLDADSFVTDNSASATTASATGEVQYTTIAFTDGADMDSLAAGESYRLRVCRDGDGSVVTDDMAGDAELYKVIVTEP